MGDCCRSRGGRRRNLTSRRGRGVRTGIDFDNSRWTVAATLRSPKGTRGRLDLPETWRLCAPLDGVAGRWATSRYTRCLRSGLLGSRALGWAGRLVSLEFGWPLTFQVLLRVGYDPGIVSESRLPPRGVARTMVWREGVAGVVGGSAGAISGAVSLARCHCSSPSQLATATQSPKVSVIPSMNLLRPATLR